MPDSVTQEGREVQDEDTRAVVERAVALAAAVNGVGHTDLETDVSIYDAETGLDLGEWRVTVARTREPSGEMSEHAEVAGRA